MKSEKSGQDPAFPQTNVSNGMSKRFYAACAAMQGLLASGKYSEGFGHNPILITKSFELADELLNKENL